MSVDDVANPHLQGRSFRSAFTPREPETTTTTTTKWVYKTMQQQLRDIRLTKIKGRLHPDYTNPFDGQMEKSVQVQPGMDSPKRELPPYKITVPLIADFDAGFRVNAITVSPSQPETAYTLQKNGIVFVGGDTGDVKAYDADELVSKAGEEDEKEMKEALKAGNESLVEQSQQLEDKKGFSPEPIFTLKQGVKVNKLLLSADYRMLCGCGTYLPMVDRVFNEGEPVEDSPGSTNASATSESFAERRQDPGNETNTSARGNISRIGQADPRNGWTTCWDVSRFTLGNMSDAVEEGPPERIFRAKRGDETFACVLADDDASIIAGGDDNKVRKYAINTQTLLKEYNASAAVLSLSVNEKKPDIVYAGLRDGDFLSLQMPLDGRAFGAVKLFNISHGQQVDALQYYNYKDTTDIVFSAGWRGSGENAPNGDESNKEYALPDNPDDFVNKNQLLKKPPPGDNPGRITVWALQTQDTPDELTFMSMSGMSWVNTLTMSQSKNFMLSGGNDGSIVFWNPMESNLGKLAAVAGYKDGEWKERGRVEIMGPEKRFSEGPILPKVDPNTPEVKQLRNAQHKVLARKSLGVTPPDVIAAKAAKQNAV
jgi:WD40 repeat protein